MTIDPDDPSTWPSTTTKQVAALAASRGGIDNVTDLNLGDHEDAFRQTLTDHVRAYHATRLLDHEVDLVQEVGLQPLTRDLVDRRIELAKGAGHIDGMEAEALHASSVFASSEQAHREGSVSLALSACGFDERPSGFNPLLREWGGEAIRMTAASRRLPNRLVTLGRPSIVVVAIDLSVPHRVVAAWPGVANVFVGTHLGIADNGADLRVRSRIPASQVEAIWQPGDPSFDRFLRLRRT